MEYYYDFHIHSCLSPCADDDMTPCNIAGMAKLCGLDVIAVTDHNTCANVRAVMRASELADGPLVVAGMELETSEAIHLAVLFEDIESCERFEKEVWRDTLRVRNKPQIFGRQTVMNENDEEIGEQENLLIVSSAIGLEKARDLAANLGGVALPAHIDKPSNGIIGILGAITDDMGFYTVELSPSAPEALRGEMRGRGYKILHNSDAHGLGNINERNDNKIELKELSAAAVIAALRNRTTKYI